ncbi:hypothetical protein [Gluconacetobacter tumulisoli]|uniref:Uncharacterized protein n=1 Tax=Gluconacetobacter tumulisoli TaxID=1286189 RepID=A0A7W4K6B2_9PROT|nr:hypothetical protein [Gluconacetobacter tumulisoli]MBB2201177.1 hypothetical protein [Gluconacetobacter tumulisoli]
MPSLRLFLIVLSIALWCGLLTFHWRKALWEWFDNRFIREDPVREKARPTSRDQA